MDTCIPIKIQLVKTLSNLLPSRMIAVKGEGEQDFSLYVTDKNGTPFPLKDNSEGLIQSIINTDGNLDIFQNGEEVTINISTDLLNIINSAIQPDDNISELINDVGYITISDIPAQKAELPINFYICTQSNSDLLYKTDTYKTVDISSLVGIRVVNCNEILRNNNDLFIIGNFVNDGSSSFVLSLINCGIVDNKLVWESSAWSSTTVPRIHASCFHRGFIYFSNRRDNNAFPQQIGKINPYDFTDLKVLTLPNSGNTVGITSEIIGYKEHVYTLISSANSVPSYMLKITEDLQSYEVLFSYGGTIGKRVAFGSPFLLYNEEFYIPNMSRSTGVFNRIGMAVFDMNGNLKRETSLQIVNTSVGNTSFPFPHWMGEINGKIIVTSVFNKFIARFDSRTLILEDSKALVNNVTDDNTIDFDGYIYLGEEVVGGNIIKIKYNNFNDATDVATVQDSNGSIKIVDSNKDRLISKTSDLINDSNFITGFTETDPIFTNSEAYLFEAGDKANLDNQSGINTGDETTASIQAKRPLKTINSQSLEGTGNIEIVIPPQFFEINVEALRNINPTLDFLIQLNQGKKLTLRKTTAPSTGDEVIYEILDENNSQVISFLDSGSAVFNGRVLANTWFETPGFLALGTRLTLDWVQFSNSLGQAVRNMRVSSNYTNTEGGGLLEYQKLPTDPNTLNRPLRLITKQELDTVSANVTTAEITANTALTNAATAQSTANTALALANQFNRRIYERNQPTNPVTGVTSEVLLDFFEIPANTYNGSGLLLIHSMFLRLANVVNRTTIRFRIGTTSTFSTSLPQIAQVNATEGVRQASLMRNNFRISDRNIVGITGAGGIANDDSTNTTAPLAAAFNTDQSQFIFITSQSVDAGDSVFLSSVKVER